MRVDSSQLQHFLHEIHARYGLVFEASRHDELRDVLAERARTLNVASIADYFQALRTSEDEWQEVASRLTVPETYFFRIPEQFEAFTQTALPARIRKRTKERVLHLASIGCATGEEPYTMAMIILSRFPELSEWTIRITGFDVSVKALAKAKRGLYTPWSLRATPAEIKERFFRHGKDGFLLDSSARNMVNFEARNALDLLELPRGSFDIVFFRNVLIYFSPESTRAAVARVAHMVPPGAYLFIGTAETLRGVSNDFSLCHTEGAFYYRREESNERATLPPRAAERTAPKIVPAAAVEADSVVEAAEQSASWIETIQKSSSRIAELTAKSAQAPANSPQYNVRGRALQVAMAMFAQEQYAAALKELERLPANDLTDADVLVFKAVLLTNSGRIAEAHAAASSALKRDHLNAGAHYVLALCSEQEGKLDTAVEHDQMAQYLDPAFAMPHVHCATIHRRRGVVAAACEHFERARSLLAAEDAARILLFGGGFSRQGLLHFCEAEVNQCKEQL